MRHALSLVRKIVVGVSLASIMTASLPLIYAQTSTTGALAGRVIDSTGAIVRDANVTLTSKANGTAQSVKTGASGEYRIPFLAPGSYSLTEEGSGMSGTVNDVTVTVGNTTTVDIISGLAGTNTTVTVESATPLLQTEDGNITTTFTRQLLEDMPLPGGDLANVPFTAPGVNLSTGAGYGSFTAFGLPATSNLFTTNGNDTMDPYNNLNNSGASNLTLGANEIQEAAVINNAYTAQYGRLAGSQVNFVTKAGGNKFHGNAQYYYNGDFLNANDWFNKHDPTNITDRPHSISNQWAGSVGGPIFHDKLFFFFDTEGLRYVLPGGGVTYVPSQAFQTAILNNLTANNPGAVNYYKSIFSIYNGSSQASRAVPVDKAADPSQGCGLFDGTTAGGVLFGTGGASCTSQFQNTAGSLNTEYLYSGRVDYVLSHKDSVNARFKHDYGVQATGTDALNPAFNANSVQPESEGQLNETHIFSPQVVNNIILSGSYYSAIFGPANIGAALAVFPTTIVFSDGDGFANVGGTDYNYPQGRNVAQYMIVDDLSLTKGKHTLKLGVNFRRNNITDYRAGVLTSGRTAFFSLTDFYNGNLGYNTGSFEQYRFAAQPKAPISIYSLGMYIQDQWQATQKLSMTLSLRMDRNANPLCHTNCFARLNAPFASLSHDPTGSTRPYNADITTGLSNAFPDTDKLILQPRLGFAYSITPKTIVRGGAGLFSDLIPAQIVDSYILNAPNVNSFTVTNTVVGQTIYVAPGETVGASQDGYAIAKQSDTALRTGFSSGQTYAQLRTATSNRFAAPAYSAVSSNLHTPLYAEWNLMVQHSFSHADAFELNYVGNYGFRLLENNSTTNAYSPTGFGGLQKTPVDVRFAIVTELTNTGYSDYNGITASFRHQFQYGFSTQLNYTYSHDLDTVSNGGLNGFDLVGDTVPLAQINPFSEAQNYGNADYDLRHSFSMNYLWQIPGETHNSLLNVATKGWTASGTLYKRTGYPFSVVNSQVAGTYLASRSGGAVLAGYLGGGEASCENGNSVCLKKSQFATTATQPAYGFGNLARNTQFRAPGYFDTDLTLLKKTKIGERVEFRIGGNAYNVLNHPNFYKPTNSVTSGTFGTITTTVTPPSSPYGSFTGSAVSGRVLQLLMGVTF